MLLASQVVRSRKYATHMGQLGLPTNFTSEKATNRSSSLKLGKTNTVLAENNSYNTALKERLALFFLFFFFKLAHNASSSLRQCSVKVALFWWPLINTWTKQKSPNSRVSGPTDSHRDGVLLRKFESMTPHIMRS